MKDLLKSLFLNSFALYTTALLWDGLHIYGGLSVILIVGVLLTISRAVLDPLLQFITLPLRVLTLGLSNALTFGLILFILSFLYKKIEVTSFTFEGISLFGVSIQGFYVSILLSYIIISVTIYVITKGVEWVFN